MPRQMSRRVYRSRKESPRENLSWEELWEGDDRGLITAWETGRKLRAQNPELAQKAGRGELPVLAWKGGVEKQTKTKKAKYGALFYLAQWQGLRGEDLDIDMQAESKRTCARTGESVVYTADAAKYGAA